jgi:hypothetical protein
MVGVAGWPESLLCRLFCDLEDDSSVPAKPDIVSHWLSLPYETLIDKVRQLVRQRHAAQETWVTIRSNPVLAAEARGTSDEAMRLMWIKQARQALDLSAPVDNRTDQVANGALPAQAGHTAQTPTPREPQSLPVTTVHATRPVSTVPTVVFRSPGH